MVADDAAIPTPAETEQLSTRPIDPPDAPPMDVLAGGWTTGAAPATSRTLSLTLTNTSAATVDAAAARLPRGAATVSDDGTGRLRLIRLTPGIAVRYTGGTTIADAAGVASVPLADATIHIIW